MISDAKLRKLTDTVPALISYIGSDLRYLFVNKAYSDWFGFPLNEIIGKKVDEVLGKEAFEAAYPEIKRALAGESVSYERELPYAGLGPRFVRVNYDPDIDASGRVNGYFTLAFDITPERAVERTNAYLAAIVESSEDAIISMDLNGAVTSWNDGAEAIYGYTAGEIIGKSVTVLMPDAKTEESEAILEQVRTGKRIDHFETFRRRKDGNVVAVSLTVSPVLDALGDIVGVSKIARDITSQKAANEIAERYRLLLGQARDIVLFVRRDTGAITDANQAAVNAYGYDRQTLFSLNIRDLLAPESLEVFDRQITEADTNGIRFETVHIRRDGERFPVEVSANGSTIGRDRYIVCIIRDIKDRRDNEDALMQSQLMLSMAMQSSKMGVWERDLDSDFVWWSPELESLFGLMKGEFKGTEQHFHSLIHIEDRDAVAAAVLGAIEKHQPYSVEFRFLHNDGSVRWMEGRGQAVYTQDGNPVRIYGIGMDITERKAAESNKHVLLEVSETIRLANDASEMLFNISKVVGEHLKARRCRFNEVDIVNRTETTYRDYCRGSASIAGVNSLSEFSSITMADMKIGRTVVNRNSQTDQRTSAFFEKAYSPKGEIAYVAVPLLRNGIWSASLLVSDDKPRDWTETEIQLLQAVAERAWLAVEKLRSEAESRESEERFARAFNASAHLLTISTVDEGRYLTVNEAAASALGYSVSEMVGRTADELGIFDEVGGRKWLIDAFRDDKVRGLELPYRSKTSKARVFNVSADMISVQGQPCVLTSSVDITEQRSAEETMRQQASLIDLSHEPIFIWDAEEGIVAWNNGCERLYGYSEKEALGQRSQILLNTIHPAGPAKFWRTLEEKGVWAGELWQTAKDGKPLVVESRQQVSESNGRKLVLETNHDITNRRKAEAAIRESEERFSKAFNSSPLAISITSLTTGKLIEVNDTFVTFMGYSREEAIGRTTQELGLWMNQDDREAEVGLLRSEGFLRDRECRYRVRNGNEVVGLLSAEKLVIGGEPCALSVVLDITERKRAQEALIAAERRATEEYHSLLSRIVPLGQVLGTARDLSLIYRTVNEFVESSMPCSAFFVSFYDSSTSIRHAAYASSSHGEIDISKLPPMKLTDDGGPNSRAVFKREPIVINRYMELIKDRPHVLVEEDGKKPNSSLVIPMIVMNRVIGTIEVQSYETEAFREEHIVALGMVANLAAVAIENVRLIEFEARAREAAESANRAKDEFLSILSHELRTPLNSILGWVRMLRLGALDEPQAEMALEVIDRNTRQQSNLIEDLLDVSRIISGQMRIERQPLDLTLLLRESTDALRPFAIGKGVALELHVPENSIQVDGDPTRLHQVVTNLLQNALKFTPSSGRIDVRLGETACAAVITVIDTGIGIEADFLPSIFERFRQADASVKRSYTGLGLGLAIVKTIVELHGGSIEVESGGRDRGASFVITIPLSNEFHETVPPEFIGGATASRGYLENARILLVDDDPESLMPVKIFLERHGAAVTEAASAQEALDKLSSFDFDILISDIGMPTMDGYQLLKKLRRMKSNQNALIPAIAMSAFASAEHRDRAAASGFQKHLAKPLDFDALLNETLQLHNPNRNIL